MDKNNKGGRNTFWIHGTFCDKDETSEYDHSSVYFHINVGSGEDRKHLELEFLERTKTVDVFYRDKDGYGNHEYDIDTDIIDKLIHYIKKIKEIK